MQTHDIDQYWPLVAPGPSRTRKAPDLPVADNQMRAADLNLVAQQIDELIAEFTKNGPSDHDGAETMAERPVVEPRSDGADLRPKRRLTDLWRDAIVSFDRKAVTYAALGFVAGIMAWHIIGFWGFLAKVVLNSGSDAAHVAAPVLNGATQVQSSGGAQDPAPVQRASQSATTTAALRLPRETPPCVALVLDRDTGIALRQPCATNREAVPEAEPIKRSDQAPAMPFQQPDAWVASTKASKTPLAQTLTPSDVDIDITGAPQVLVRP